MATTLDEKVFRIFDTHTPIVGVNRNLANNWKNEEEEKLTGRQTHRNRKSQEDDLKTKHKRR